MLAGDWKGRGKRLCHEAACARWARRESRRAGQKATGRAESDLGDSVIELNTSDTNHDQFNPINAWNNFWTSQFSTALNKTNTLTQENPGMTRAGSPLETKAACYSWEVIGICLTASVVLLSGLVWQFVRGPTPPLLLWKVYQRTKQRLSAVLESTGKFCYFSSAVSWKKFKLSAAKT